MSLVLRVKQPVDCAPQSRLEISDGLQRNAKGAIKTTLELLAVVVAMTQNVPYLSIILGVLGELMKIYNQVKELKSEWKMTAHITHQIKSVVDKIRVRCETEHVELPLAMVEPLEELERCILVTLQTLVRCRAGSKRWKDRARVVLNRGDLVDDVKQCRTRMQAALDLFVAKLQIDQTFNIHSIAANLREMRVHLAVSSEPTNNVSSPMSIPFAPNIFHGRAGEVDHVVDLVIDKPPAKIARLNPGDIGKSSIALTAIQQDNMAKLYGNQRLCVSFFFNPHLRRSEIRLKVMDMAV